MNIGGSILEFRKKLNLSQEELADKIGVTRQTISKWELNETTPSLNQLLELAKVFNISLNDLTNEAVITKLEKNEIIINKLSKKIIVICITLFIIFVLELIAVFSYKLGYEQDKKHSTDTIQIICTINDEEYRYAITYDGTGNIIFSDGSPFIHDKFIAFNDKDKTKYKKVIPLLTDISNYFKDNGGLCE